MNFNITGNTKTICLLGCPVIHSISPQIHNHIFRTLELPYIYIPLNVPPNTLHSAIYTVRTSMAGANVTTPHKGAALRYCDDVSWLSMAAGAVNTLYIKDGRLCGTTTDANGFYKALEAIGYTLNGDDDAVILGSGGTARTLGAAMILDKKCRSLTITARTAAKAAALAATLGQLGTIPVGHDIFGSPNSNDIFDRCTLLVNCTSVGMYPYVEDTPLDKKFFHPRMTVFDAIYNPDKTRFLKEATEAGCTTQNGLLMLLHQGLESFHYWTGVRVPTNIFDEAMLRSYLQ